MVVLPEDIMKLLLAILIGGMLGAEREYRDRAAGFRTIILICLGATLFTVFSLKLGGSQDPVRIAASIVSGVGFLGAGAILRGPGRVVGLTTASTIWLAAALGVGVGGGYFVLASVAAGLALIVLSVFPRIEHWIDNVRDVRTYQVSCPISSELFAEIEGMIHSSGLRTSQSKRMKSGHQMICTWEVHGSPRGHEELTNKLLGHEEVKEFQV